MSHDLYYVANEARKFDPNEASTYLSNVPHCKVQTNTSGGYQAWYEHPDTGVYWVCEYAPPSAEYESALDPEKALLAGVIDTGLSFSLNYLRPRYFGLESMPFAAAIARDLSLQVYDPQDDDSTIAGADADKLTASWIKGNEWAARGRPDPLYLDAGLAMEMWRYNTHLADVWSALEILGIGAVVPKVFQSAMRGSTRVLRTIAWGEGFRFAFPPCDIVCMLNVAKPSLFERSIGKKDLVSKFANWSDVERVLAPSLEKTTVCGLDYLLQSEHSAMNFKQITASIPSKRFKPSDFNSDISGSMFVDVPKSVAPE